MKSIRAILHRMVPGTFRDPFEVIGTCVYCDTQVTYADGDTDDAGSARHDRCWKLIRKNAERIVSATSAFLECTSAVAGDSSIATQVTRVLDKMPDRIRPEDALRYAAALSKIVSTESTIDPGRKVIVLGKLNSVKIKILAECCT